MELIKKSWFVRLKNLGDKIYEDNLFLLASSVSYYSALAIAPFLLILLGVASLIGGDIQERVIILSTEFSPEAGKMIQIIFNNVNEGVSVGSISGIIGIIVLLWTASLVFLQLRYAFDVIYGYHNPQASLSIGSAIKERLFAMMVVVLSGMFLIISSSLPGVVQFFLERSVNYYLYKAIAFCFNILVYVIMFSALHFYAPSKRPGKRESLKMGLVSSLFFLFGNFFLTGYLKGVAVSSIYGAAGSLLVFLMWTYYSSFTLFLSSELFLFFRKIRKVQ